MKVEVEKQLKIKIKVLERCIREYEMYVKEVESGSEKLESIGPADDKYRQLQQVLQESKSMVTDTKERATTAEEELVEFIEKESLKNEMETQVELFKHYTEVVEKFSLLA